MMMTGIEQNELGDKRLLAATGGWMSVPQSPGSRPGKTDENSGIERHI
jgi:hypothetical protein